MVQFAVVMVIGAYDVPVPRRGNQKARTARMAIRCTRVTIQPPKNNPHLPNITLDVVQAIETRPPDGIKPLNWTLLTTVPTTTLEQAHERISWYARRWDIEVYHRTLKSGCRIEDRQFGTASRLEACLAIDLVVAWRGMKPNRQCRETPDAPCTVHFRPEEWKALWIRTGSGTMPSDDEVPTLREAVRRVASLGGFLGRKSDGEPGRKRSGKGCNDSTISPECTRKC